MRLKAEIAKRMEQCGLELHPEKTKIAYCKDANRTGDYKHHSFDFLGYSFCPRFHVTGAANILSTSRRQFRLNQRVFSEIRQWCLHKRSDLSVKDIIRWLNPVVGGWIEYYGAFFRSELIFIVYHLDKLKSFQGTCYTRR